MNESVNGTKRIKSLEGLRAIAFVLVFLSHTGPFFEGIGMWSVSLFFVLSGFVSVISQYNKKIETTIKARLKYMIKKIWKLYPLCFVTNLMMLPFDIFGIKKQPIIYIIKKFIINISLIYEIIPISNSYTLNGPAWFMGVLVIFYFCFPGVIKYIKRKDKNQLLSNSLLLIICDICIAIIGKHMPVVPFKNKMYKSHIYQWFVYFFPFSRIIDILIGCNLGGVFIKDNKRVISKASLKELLACILATITIVYAHFDYFYWDIVIVCLPSSILLIYYFAYGQGIISKAIVNKITMYLARISSYGFLIHCVVFRYLESAFVIIFELDKEYFTLINATLGFILTVLCCEIWKKIQKRIDGYIVLD